VLDLAQGSAIDSIGSLRTAADLLYRIEAFDPKGHRFRVGLLMKGEALKREKLTLKLASWIPGSYMIREFAKHVLSVDAFMIDLGPGNDDANVQAENIRRIQSLCGHWVSPIGIFKSAKAQWEIAQTCDRSWIASSDKAAYAVYVEALIYAWDFSVRAAHLDQNHGFFNPTSLCLRLAGAEDIACEVDLIAPIASEVVGRWQLATNLEPAPGGAGPWSFGRYRANSYDELADHPVEMGAFSKFQFAACGVPHWLVVSGRHRFDADRVCHDLQKICETQIRFFDPSGKAPFERYLFLLTVSGDGYGGLEHRNSTALICRRDDLPPPNRQILSGGTPSDAHDEPSEAYRRFLGLASHEYFHSWHVKRIKPEAFIRYDFDCENYTRLLWVFEGFTSYYDELMLLRAGVVSKASYLKSLETTINQVLRNPSRHAQSLADSSFDAWIKYYRQDENAANAVVSYYAKGALVALCIDLLIREQSKERYSLDDLMRLLWTRYGSRACGDEAGLPEDGLIPALLEACEIDSESQKRFIAREVTNWVEGTVDLPLKRLLATAKVQVLQQSARPAHGLRYRTQQHEMVVTAVLVDSPAHRAGLSAGDQLLAIDGIRASDSVLKEALQRCESPIEIVAFRRDELFFTQLVPATDTHPQISLTFMSTEENDDE